jgi:hypothetical protein
MASATLAGMSADAARISALLAVELRHRSSRHIPPPSTFHSRNAIAIVTVSICSMSFEKMISRRQESTTWVFFASRGSSALVSRVSLRYLVKP